MAVDFPQCVKKIRFLRDNSSTILAEGGGSSWYQSMGILRGEIVFGLPLGMLLSTGNKFGNGL